MQRTTIEASAGNTTIGELVRTAGLGGQLAGIVGLFKLPVSEYQPVVVHALRLQRTVLGDALADGLGTGLQLAEDLQGARVIGGYYSGWHSTKGRLELLVGFWHAILFQQ
jgi:hypothetical protein